MNINNLLNHLVAMSMEDSGSSSNGLTNSPLEPSKYLAAKLTSLKTERSSQTALQSMVGMLNAGAGLQSKYLDGVSLSARAKRLLDQIRNRETLNESEDNLEKSREELAEGTQEALGAQDVTEPSPVEVAAPVEPTPEETDQSANDQAGQSGDGTIPILPSVDILI